MIRFHCLECGMLIQANDSAVGRSAKCPGCGAVLEIPMTSAPATVPPAAPVAAPPSAPAAPKSSKPAPPPRRRQPLPRVAPAAPPVVPTAAATESLSLDELLGSASAAPPVHGNGSAPQEMDFSEGYQKTGGKAPKKTASPGKPGKATAKDSEAPTQKIRNFGIAAIAAGVLGLALFAVPFAGPAVGVIGAGMGFYAISLASARRNSPIALALAGTAVSVVAAGFGGYWTYSGMQAKTVVANMQKAAPDANAELAARNAALNTDQPSVATTVSQFAGAAVKSAVSNAVADARNPMSFAAAAVRSAAVDPAKRAARLAAASGPKAMQSAAPVTLRLQDPSGVAKNATADASLAAASGSDGETEPAPAVKAPIRWAAADQNEAQGSDDVKISITKAVTGTLFLRTGANSLLDIQETRQAYLQISVKIQNNQPVGTVDYKGWMSLPDSATTLTDDKGNAVARFDVAKAFPANQHVTLALVHPAGTIETSQSMEDTLVFLLPAKSAEYLLLTLSGNAVGLPDDLHFQIPLSMIKPAEAGNSLLPLGPP